MEKILLSKKQVKEDGNLFTLEYWLLSYETSDGEKLYGVQINKYDGDSFQESESVCGMSFSKEYMKKWISTLAEGLVTPVTLLYLSDDAESYLEWVV